ncbi:hypothetical protein AbraIFM66950_002939 [Aspergillus brasiliensis]|nr:hypothetical protein AbraIFM66950_002939 [Aspergillus brasiliensis]
MLVHGRKGCVSGAKAAPNSSPTVPPRESTAPHTPVQADSNSPINGQTNLIRSPKQRAKRPLRFCTLPSRRGCLGCPGSNRLMWGIQRGVSVIRKSGAPSRIENNLDLDGWALTDEAFAELSAIMTGLKAVGNGWTPIRVFVGDGG